MYNKIFALFFLLAGGFRLAAQDNNEKELILSGEFKTRMEIRNGYRTLVPDDTSVAVSFQNRVRLNLEYRSDILNAYISFQDARFWGEYGGQYKGGSLNLFEGYTEIPLANGFSVKVGRQRLILDNQRLFAENDWRVWGRSHDAIRFRFNKGNLSLSAFASYGQSAEKNFGSGYDPIQESGEDYKFLHLFHYRQDFGNFEVSALHVGDGFESIVQGQKGKLKMRYTSGGKFSWRKRGYELSNYGYIQYGKTSADQKILAWYLNPEFTISAIRNTQIRIGAELSSGQKNDHSTFNSFVPLYGVAHRFNGYMDHFTRFPNDTKSGGLINPYLHVEYILNPKIRIAESAHYFGTQRVLTDMNGAMLKKSLCLENDLVLKFQPNKIIGLEAGYSFLIPTKTLEFVKNTETNKFNQWAYLQLTVKPEFFRKKFINE